MKTQNFFIGAALQNSFPGFIDGDHLSVGPGPKFVPILRHENWTPDQIRGKKLSSTIYFEMASQLNQ
jgi:hypothetical protein